MTALVFIDGFDKYGPAGNVNAASAIVGEWSGTAPTIVAPLSSLGYAIQIPNSSMSAALPSSLARISGSIRFQIAPGSTTGNSRLFFQNGASSVFSINFDAGAGGQIQLRTGSVIGTIVNSGGAVGTGATHVLQFDVTIGASAAYTFNLDGILLFSGTGNTGNGQASLNTVLMSQTSNISLWVDDLCLYDPTHAAYNSAIMTQNVVVETQFPSGDNQTQFTNDGNVIPPAGIAVRGVYRVTGTASFPGANQLLLIKITPVANCTLNSVSMIPNVSAGAAKFKAVIYADSAGSPGALANTGTEVVGCTSGTTLTLPLSTPQALTSGTSYWIGLITDTSISYQQYDATTNLSIRKANTYTSGAPNPAGGGFTVGQPTLLIWGNATGAATNWPSVSLNPPLGTSAAQVHSATVGQEDLFTFPVLASNPTAIYGGAVKAFMSKSDSGSRTASLNMKSGATDSTGSNAGQGLSTTKQWQGSIYDLDPGTGAAWTNAGVNDAKSGVSVAS